MIYGIIFFSYNRNVSANRNSRIWSYTKVLIINILQQYNFACTTQFCAVWHIYVYHIHQIIGGA